MAAAMKEKLQRLEKTCLATELGKLDPAEERSLAEEGMDDRWDSSLQADIDSGKLDTLAAEALAEYGSGKCKPL